MSQDLATDLVRWTFRVDLEKQAEIEQYLSEMGMDVTSYEDGSLHVSWDEPDQEADSIIEHLWEMNGTPFDVTHEAFHRTSLLIYHSDDADTSEGPAAAD